MKRIFFFYILYLALFTAVPTYGMCVVNFHCDHSHDSGGTPQFFLLKKDSDGEHIEVARGPQCSFSAIPYDGTVTFVACSQMGAITACDWENPVELTCLK